MFSSVSVSSDAQDTQLSMFAALATSMPQDTVDLILADGSNQRNSTLRIAARFRKDFSMEENAAFLQREYGRGGKGFTVGRQKVSAYWDVNGIRMDYGESAQTDTALTITWQDAAARIRELLDVGRYITQTEMDFTDYNERSELADQLWYVYRDDGLRMPEEWNSKKGFSDDVKLIRAESESPQQRDRIIARYLADIENIDTINSTRRRYHNLQRLAENLLAYQRPQLDFAAPQTLPKPAERFITQDEIDIELSRGTPYENGRRDVFNYFRQPHTLKERIDFLKRSYGIGGHSAALGGADDAWEDHDSKGILLRRGNLTKPYTRTLLSWQNAAQRIAELIDANRYLKADELAENQKREQEAALELPIATPESSVTTSESSDTVDDIAAPPKECELGFGKLGNGTTVWNRLEERDGDYRTVAHISDDGIASIFDPDLPSDAVDRIHAAADQQRIRAQTIPDASLWQTEKVSECGDEIVQRMTENEALLNSMGTADEAQIQTALENALAHATAEVVQQNPDVQQVYIDNADFREQLSHYALDRALDVLHAQAMPQPETTHKGISYREQNYRALDRLMPGLLDGTNSYVRMESGPSFMRLVGESIGENEISLAHYYEQNGDLMHDPEITLRVDRENRTLTPLSFQQDNLGIFYEVQYPKQERELTDFMRDWLRNIEQQGYRIVNAHQIENEYVQESQDEILSDDAPEVSRALRTYQQYKQTYPQHVVLVQVADHYETYGADAQRVQPILQSREFERKTESGEILPMTGFTPASSWAVNMVKLWSKGNDVLVVGLDEQQEYAPIKERKAADYVPIGKEFEMDGHRFKVDSVNFMTGCAQLQDLTMFASGYPLFRSEPLESVHELLEAQMDSQAISDGDLVPNGNKSASDEELAPNGNKSASDVELVPNGNKSAPDEELALNGNKSVSDEEPAQDEAKLRQVVIDLRPREQQPIPMPAQGNYRIHDDHIGEGGQRTKADRNIEAIRTLTAIEQEYRSASADEQEILAQYVGWGGVPQIFDESNSDWKDRREELQGLLTPNEYAAARASTLNAHYTAPIVIRSIYQALSNMGFKDGNVLEPACGIGNFFGMLPDEMQGSMLYGVELDSITGRIAQKLYPQAQISVQGFEHSALPDSYFDVAVGNVPFGAYSLADTRYDKYHFRIHDYFFAKTLDKVRPGGIIAFVTSKGTMDKLDSSVRSYIAQRAELLGAIRLPNNTFLANAGTSVTTDILFLQKRERILDVSPAWLRVAENADGVPVNQYFLDNPHMLLGKMAFFKNMYGNEKETGCLPIHDANLEEQLSEAIMHIHGKYVEAERPEVVQDSGEIPADITIPQYSFALRNGQVYYRSDHTMKKCELSPTESGRVRGMIALRDLTRELIQAQLAGANDSVVGSIQAELRERYDAFSAKYGLLSDRRNAQVFRDDDGYYLLTSLEILDEEHKLEHLADMFTRRTIAQNQVVDHVDTAAEALAVSMAERACVDLDFMSDLTGMDKDKLIDDLRGQIFQNPYGKPAPFEHWETADEYLSGDVRQKLRAASAAVEAIGDEYQINVEALKGVQPKDLEPHEIDVRLGATWIPKEDITAFIHELLQTPYYMRYRIKADYATTTGAWNVSNKTLDSNNDRANTQYGTGRRIAYKIIEESLNLRDVRVFDLIIDAEGNERRVLNQKETILAQQKQAAIREAFKDWIWKEPKRRERLCRLYNDTYNCIHPREYDGSHLRFVGMNPELKLRSHQKNAVARILYGGNTLLAHTVGAGKTAVMVASIMEKKRIGLGHKALLAVPNHLTEQTAAEFLRFYPGARILVATKRDFEKQNRKRFIGRIATGDYDAIIMGHSQFEKIPLSKERQKQLLENQIQEIMDGINEIKHSNGEKFSIKEMERTRKALETRLKKLNSDEDKDAVVTFEELGVDMLYVDEAHSYKNLAVVTKMRNVAGINTMEAKKSSDMYGKTRYISELTGDRGIVFATGTPISNSMTELYTMQRYLQTSELARKGLSHFDSWAATFGETVTAIELAPEGTGYRLKTRFSKFYNLPELMSMFKQAADIQTPDMLNLPVPALKGRGTQNIKTEASDFQHAMVEELAERAEEVRKGSVDPHEDNMLRITNDGRLLALDARLIDPTLPDDPNSKVNACVQEVLRIHNAGEAEKHTQLIFCDLSTPKAERTDGVFDDVYHDIRRKLVRAGVPENEIAFIHDANTEVKKDELFAKVRSGTVRILIGSTAKMGAGTNVQTRLKAVHHIDCPWRPSDLQQRDGRIVRQGNSNKEVEVLRYITQDTFDAYSYQLVENKQKFISQVFTSKSPARGAEDLDEMALSYAEVKALAAGNPAIREKMDLDVQVSKLKLLKSNWQSERYRLEKRVNIELPAEIAQLENRIKNATADIAQYNTHKPSAEDGFVITLMGRVYDKRVDAGEQLESIKAMVQGGESVKIGDYCGFSLRMTNQVIMIGTENTRIEVQGENSYYFELGDSAHGNIIRLENLVSGISDIKIKDEAKLETAKSQLQNAREELDRPWPQEQELQEKNARLTQLNMELDVGGGDAGAAALAEDDDEPERERPARNRTRER